MKLYTILYLVGIFVVLMMCFNTADGKKKPKKSKLRCPKMRLSNGRVKMRMRGRMAYFSCKVGYALVGKKLAVCLSGNRWNTEKPICVTARGCPTIRNPGNLKISTTMGGAKKQFSCKPYMLLKGNSTIYCTGKNWTDSVPECIVPPTECDFEDASLCGWSHCSNSNMDGCDFNWSWLAGRTPTRNTGPDFDHTFGNKSGHYMYMESSKPRLPFDQASLFSPLYQANQSGSCFTFWYHMHGQGIGTLKILIQPEGINVKQAEMRPHFTATGYHGEMWLQGSIIVPPMLMRFRMIIEGTRNNSFLSDMAIDDVKLHPVQCDVLFTTQMPSKTSLPAVNNTAVLSTNSFITSETTTGTIVPKIPTVRQQSTTSAAVKGQPTPTAAVKRQTTPTTDVKRQTTPTANVKRQTTPTANMKGQITPTAAVKRQTTPTAYVKGQTTPTVAIKGQTTAAVRGQTLSTDIKMASTPTPAVKSLTSTTVRLTAKTVLTKEPEKLSTAYSDSQTTMKRVVTTASTYNSTEVDKGVETSSSSLSMTSEVNIVNATRNDTFPAVKAAISGSKAQTLRVTAIGIGAFLVLMLLILIGVWAGFRCRNPIPRVHDRGCNEDEEMSPITRNAAMPSTDFVSYRDIYAELEMNTELQQPQE